MYNEKQLKAIESDLENIVIIAPPGSGKTWTMSGAIDYFLKSEENVTNVTSVTFTVAAAEELKNRVFNDAVHTSTIHSWSYTQLNRLSQEHSFRVKILQEDNILMMLKPLMKKYGLGNWAKWQLYHFVMGNVNIDIAQNIKAKYKAISQAYIEEKRNRRLYDFTDLPLYLKNKLEDYDEYIHTDALFVDEFQDVDPVQLEVFDRVVAKKKFFIGDPDQAIYIFRGASSNVFYTLKDFAVYKLDINYRSYQNILNYATSFKNFAESKKNSSELVIPGCVSEDLFDKSTIKAIKGNGGVVFVQDSFNRFTCYGDNSLPLNMDSVRKEILNKQPRILCRTNKQVKEIEELGYKNVSTIHKSKGLEFPNVIMNNFDIDGDEDINIAYVGITRAENRLMILNQQTIIEALIPLKAQIKEQNRQKEASEFAF